MLPSELLAKPEAWTKGALARNPDGFGVEWDHQSACSWCVLGAIYRCFGDEVKSLGNHTKRRALADSLGIEIKDLPEWNDDRDRTHGEVLAALRKAGL